MNNEDLKKKIDKIFRANTVEKEVIVGQYDQTKTVKVISDIEELKSDIKDLIDGEFKVGKIDKSEIFIGNKKIGASYSVEVAIEIAKEWGFKYVAWNEGRLWSLKGERLDIYYDEL